MFKIEHASLDRSWFEQIDRFARLLSSDLLAPILDELELRRISFASLEPS